MHIEDTYESLISRDDHSFDDFYRIYAESMPLREQKPRAAISAMASRSDYKILLVKRNGITIGFSVLFVPMGESFSLLEYMAIHTAYRDSGAGGKLFQRSIQEVTSDRGDIPLLLEVDSDRGPSADQAIRRKRKNFYRRLGCFQIDGLHYLLPLPGQGSPPEMDLMIYLPDSFPPIQKSQLERWLKVIYQQVYNCSPDDPRIIQMMNSLTDPIRIV